MGASCVTYRPEFANPEVVIGRGRERERERERDRDRETQNILKHKKNCMWG
jgi:hypothetical protein